MKIRRINPIREVQKKKVAAYARVSTLSEEQDESFETQVAYYTALINSRPDWEFAGVYADHGKSGLSVEKRPEFQRMFQDAVDGKIEIILVKSISRFGRNSLEAMIYVHKLKEYRVEVRFEREGISSFDPQADMVFNFLVAVAQEESRSISMNTRWANEKLAKQGIRHIGSNKVLGYDEVNGVLTPNKDAWVVRFIFEEYAAGKSMGKIADELRMKGFSTMRGKERMDESTIAAILRNELYKGDQRIQKQPPTELLTKKPDYSKEYISYYVEDNHEGIVSRELWDKVQEVIITPKTTYANKKSHPLRGRIICGECGEPFVRVSRKNASGVFKTWVCKGRNTGSGCSCPILREELVEEKIGEGKMVVYGDGRIEVKE